ncbi:uncharacterized protein LOC142341663 [Convolutriloba macropyga]|uniref:uncharacterized protein LOC142341663 n=1 Tax=Convolutriloba macropyga TaxID=536237 RepID=UPI003F52298F
MENNNPSGVSQWSVFSSHHCRMWFGLVKEFDSAGVCKDSFRVMHSFKPRRSDQSPAAEIEHSNVYYYDDERGTVTSSPRCGPWFYKEEDSTSIGFKGVKHPKWPNTKYIFFPSGSGIMFNNSAVNYGSVETCIKLFLLHPARPNIRLSIMIEYCELSLQGYKIYLENSDGWKSDFWEYQENQSESGLISPSSASLISRQTIDENLETTISTEVNNQDTKLPTSEFKNGNVFSFDSASAGTLFDHILPGYASFHPTRHIAITCPISIKPTLPSSPSDATSPISLSSPVDAISVTSFVGVRWNQSPDTSYTDFIAQFDADSRFSSLTEINYKHSFAREL